MPTAARWVLLALTAVLGQEEAAVRAGVAPDEEARVEERSGPYARWSHGPPTDPTWFPIGVWLQEPRLAPRYRELGVNTFVGLWQGPTEAQLRILTREGMKIVCGPNRVGMRHKANRSIIAWMQTDEPENKASDRSGPRATVKEATDRYELIQRRDPTRPVWMNLGQGVANDEWRGLGAPRSDYPDYVAACDIVSFDVYPITNIRKRDGENYLWYVAKGIGRLREWGGDEKVVWNVIETTRGPQETKKPTPEQMRAEVWLSLVAGSRGIVYFCHEFDPDVSAAALLLDPEMCSAVQRVNDEILRFAPVLNLPSLEGHVSVTSAKPRIPIATLLKRDGDTLYLFAIATRNGGTGARLELIDLPDFAGAEAVHVLGEARDRPLAGGSFRDGFGPYQLHVYRIQAP